MLCNKARDGSISAKLPSLGVTSLNRILNPRIVFTSHINNIGMYTFIQSELGNRGLALLHSKISALAVLCNKATE